MSADYYFRMGSTHSICQDYALAGESNGIMWAALSDGCSGVPKPEQPGSPYTDFGSRFLVTSAIRNMGEIADGNIPFTKIITDADAIRRQASLPSDSLDATLLVVTEKNGIINIVHTGDGLIAYRKRTGEVYYSKRTFAGGMPAYLNYQIKTIATNEYLKQSPTWNSIVGEKQDNIYNEIVIEFANESVTSSYSQMQFDKSEIDLVLLFSDGIDSFVDCNNNPIPTGQILNNILDLPKMVGQFVTRSCNFFLQKHCKTVGWKHIDDFSCAGIFIK